METPEDKYLNDVYEILALPRTTSIHQAFQLRIDELGLSKTQAERLIGLDKKTLDPILNGTGKRFDSAALIKLATFLGLPTVSFIRLYIEIMTSSTKLDLDAITNRTFIHEYFDVHQLKKLGFISQKDDYQTIEAKIKINFNLLKIKDYATLANVLFSKTNRSHSDKMRNFWVKSAHAKLKSIDNPNPFDRDRVKEIVAKVKAYSRDIENGLLTIARSLYMSGVTLIVQTQLPNSQIRGATIPVANKPAIVLTGIGKRYDSLWFALIHELYHVLWDFDQINQVGYHLSGEGDLFLLNEREADEFAAEALLSADKLSKAEPFIRNDAIVRAFAKQWQIHESIIYGLYCHNKASKGENVWPFFSRYNPGIDRSTNQLALSVFYSGDSMETRIGEIKTILQS